MARHWKKPPKKVWIPLAIVLVIIAVVWIYLEVWLTRYVNDVLDDMGNYHGEVRDVDVHLYRGAYVIHDLKIVKKTGKVPDPFVTIPTADLSIQWSALFHGRIVSDIELDHPVLTFAIARNGTTQAGEGVPWQKKIDDLMPIDINRVTLKNGEVHYKDFSASRKVDLDIHNLNGEMRNLRNVYDKAEKLPATIDVSGISIGKGKMNLKGKLNVLSEPMDMNVGVKLEGANLTALNNFTKDIAGFDFERGNLSMYSELLVNKGSLDGYIKILAHKVHVLSVENDGNPIQVAWEAIMAVVVEIFTNQPKDQFAIQIPLSGKLNDPKTSTWPAIFSIVRNAFVKAFSSNIKNELEDNARGN